MMEIKCKVVEHEPCLCCGALETTMVKIGVFTMCLQCWQKEFNQTEIPIKSEAYQNYVAWLSETDYSK